MSIEVINISKKYGSQKALDAISFSINKGEIVGFLGPNGAGKSTLMKILTTYIAADAGMATVNGFDVALIIVSATFFPKCCKEDTIRSKAKKNNTSMPSTYNVLRTFSQT